MKRAMLTWTIGNSAQSMLEVVSITAFMRPHLSLSITASAPVMEESKMLHDMSSFSAHDLSTFALHVTSSDWFHLTHDLDPQANGRPWPKGMSIPLPPSPGFSFLQHMCVAGWSSAGRAFLQNTGSIPTR